MSIMDKLKATMTGDGPKIPGGLRGLAAVAAVAWGSNTATRLVGEALDQRQSLEGDLLALNQAIAEAQEKLDTIPFVVDHNHAKIAEAIRAGRFDAIVVERAVDLGYSMEFANLNTTDDVPHRLLDVDEPVPGIEASEVDTD